MIKETDFIENKCKHKRMRTYKRKDKKMLWGFYKYDKCLDCGMRRYTISCQINLILNMIAKDLKKPREKLTAKDIYKQQNNFKYFSKKIRLIDCKELVNNPNKFI